MVILEVIFIPSGDETLLQVEHLNLLALSCGVLSEGEKHWMDISALGLIEIISRMCEVIGCEIISILIEAIHEDYFNMTNEVRIIAESLMGISSRQWWPINSLDVPCGGVGF
jgi:hypothetical protein